MNAVSIHPTATDHLFATEDALPLPDEFEERESDTGSAPRSTQDCEALPAENAVAATAFPEDQATTMLSALALHSLPTFATEQEAQLREEFGDAAHRFGRQAAACYSVANHLSLALAEAIANAHALYSTPGRGSKFPRWLAVYLPGVEVKFVERHRKIHEYFRNFFDEHPGAIANLPLSSLYELIGRNATEARSRAMKLASSGTLVTKKMAILLVSQTKSPETPPSERQTADESYVQSPDETMPDSYFTHDDEGDEDSSHVDDKALNSYEVLHQTIKRLCHAYAQGSVARETHIVRALRDILQQFPAAAAIVDDLR